MRGRGFIAALALLAACGGEGPSPVGLPSGGGKSAMRLFQGGPVAPALRPNAEMVQDYLDLAFRLESGRFAVGAELVAAIKQEPHERLLPILTQTVSRLMRRANTLKTPKPASNNA